SCHSLRLYRVCPFSPRPGHHRALPSFPTRRSSDLARGSRRGQRGQRDELAGTSAPEGSRGGFEADWGSHAWRTWFGAGRCAEPGDRKSTRLNSSHVSISYAVFCLKKKQQTRNITSV